jgi:hypothetical protein
MEASLAMARASGGLTPVWAWADNTLEVKKTRTATIDIVYVFLIVCPRMANSVPILAGILKNCRSPIEMIDPMSRRCPERGYNIESDLGIAVGGSDYGSD